VEEVMNESRLHYSDYGNGGDGDEYGGDNGEYRSDGRSDGGGEGGHAYGIVNTLGTIAEERGGGYDGGAMGFHNSVGDGFNGLDDSLGLLDVLLGGVAGGGGGGDDRRFRTASQVRPK
jgi:hypothetical protein